MLTDALTNTVPVVGAANADRHASPVYVVQLPSHVDKTKQNNHRYFTSQPLITSTLITSLTVHSDRFSFQSTLFLCHHICYANDTHTINQRRKPIPENRYHKNRTLSYLLPKTSTRKIRYQIACQTHQ